MSDSAPFRSNPFRALATDEWADIAVLPPAVEAIADAMADVQIVAQKGRGKTSVLLGLANHVTAHGLAVVYERLQPGQHRFNTNLENVDVFLVDEAQRLFPAELYRLLSLRSPRLILSTHVNMSLLFRLAGRNVKTIRLSRMVKASTHQHLRTMIERRLEYFATSFEYPRLTDEAYTWLLNTFTDDFRAIEWFLYDVFQHLPARVEITEQHLAKQYRRW